MARGAGEGVREKVAKWNLCKFCFYNHASSHASGGTFAPSLVPLSLQELPLLFYFAISVNQLPELHVWAEKPLSN